MSSTVSSGLKATAQEWQPTSVTSKAAVPAGSGSPSNQNIGFNQFYNSLQQAGAYYPQNGSFYPPAEGGYGYFPQQQPSPWDLATMGHQQRSHPPRHGRRGRGQGRSQQRRHSHDNSNGIPIKTKKRKKKKKKGPATDNNPRSDTVMKAVEIVPNRILVFKNLPFSFTVKALEDIIQAECNTKPDNTSFHRDKNGQFKGFCFVYFNTIDEAALVQERLHGYDLQGRKWSIEFKRMTPEESDSSSGTTLVPTSLPRTGSHDRALNSMGMGAHGKLASRSKFRSVSESDADMNWRRTKAESDFPPKDEAGRKLYRKLQEYKEKHAALARASLADGAAQPDKSPDPLEIAIGPSQKTQQRLLQECLKRLNLNHRIKDEEGDQITYEITPRPETHSNMGGLGGNSETTQQRRRRGGSSGNFETSTRASAPRRTSNATANTSTGQKIVKSQKYAQLTVVQAAELQAAALKSPASSGERSPFGSPAALGDGDASNGMSAVNASSRSAIRNKDRTESRDFGSRIASGPDGSPGFHAGPRGRFGSPTSTGAATPSQTSP